MSKRISRWSMVLVVAASVAASVAPSVGRANPTLTTLVTFEGANGSGPAASLIADAAGNVYGTTTGGGANGAGTVFQLAAGTHQFSLLASLDAATTGVDPEGRLFLDGAGNLLGTAYWGGAHNLGAVFQVAAQTHTVSPVVTFDGANGAHPDAGLVADLAGNLYGATAWGGDHDMGAVFRLASGTRQCSTLASFDGSTACYPNADLTVDPAGNLYGASAAGGTYSNGAVFQVAPATGAITPVYTFTNSGGGGPNDDLISDAAGNLYGLNSNGDLFQIAAGNHAYSTLASLAGVGEDARGILLQDAAGNFYGVTYTGGAYTWGTVYKIAAGTGQVTTLAEFDLDNGGYPSSGLVADSNGNLYGTTQAGGDTSGNSGFGWGTLFELSGTGFVVVPEPSCLLLLPLALGLLARRGRCR